jgi:hypothetical protein
MSSVITSQPVLQVRSIPHGLEVTTHDSSFELVKTLLNSGSIADGAWGSEAHLAALNEVEKHLAFVRMEIAKCAQEPNDAG